MTTIATIAAVVAIAATAATINQPCGHVVWLISAPILIGATWYLDRKFNQKTPEK